MDPVAARDRILLLDVLRGFAIFGMFTVNMTADLPWGSVFRQQPLPPIDSAVMLLIDLLTNGKFITIFTLLFGIGLYVQLERARAAGTRFAYLYLRRLAGLVLIASAAVMVGLDVGILVLYAQYGVVLLLLSKRSPGFLLTSAVLCLVVAHLYGSVYYEWRERREEVAVEEVATDQGTPVTADEAESIRARIYREGTFRQIAAERAKLLRRYLTNIERLVYNLDILGLLLVGMYVGRRGLWRNGDERRAFARRVLPWLLAIGASSELVSATLFYFVPATKDSLSLTLIMRLTMWPLGWPVLGLGYAAGITLLLERREIRKVLALLGPAGRLALTNYLLTTLVCAVICYSWGFGLYGQVRPIVGLMVVLAVYPLQVAGSLWWVRHFRFGPFEWLWRVMTYGKCPQMLVQPAT